MLMTTMGDDYLTIREDGFLNVDFDTSSIVYHNILNLILLKTKSGTVHVLDVNSGVLLESSDLSSEKGIKGLQYIPGADRVFYWDEKGVGARSDYNGVLLLHSALQIPLNLEEECRNIRLELLFSEAVILHQCLQILDSTSIEGLSEVVTTLKDAIDNAKKATKKGVKSQKWCSIVLDMDQAILRQVANGVVAELKSQNRRIPALAIASSLAHRANDLVPGSKPQDSRSLMSSEAARKDTFRGWPHMDYKWALPAQMAQAGFYHQPSSKGEDRAMCFTCMVCLVCWEKSDEPWVEHERHSPNCPFIRGEYTHNVPISVANATSCAVNEPDVKIVSQGNTGNFVATGKLDGQVTIWKFDCSIKQYKTIALTPYDAIFSGKLTSESNKVWSECLQKDPHTYSLELTAMTFVGLKPEETFPHVQTVDEKDKSNSVKRKQKASLICGVNVTRSEPIQSNVAAKHENSFFQSDSQTSDPVKAMNDQNEAKTNFIKNKNTLFLLAYDMNGQRNSDSNTFQVSNKITTNKNGGSTKVVTRLQDATVYEDIYCNNYSDEESNMPNWTNLDDQWSVVNVNTASSSKEMGSEFWFPKKIMVTKHIKVFPNSQHPIKLPTKYTNDEDIPLSWMPSDTTMQEIVAKLTKEDFVSIPPIIKMSDTTDSALISSDPFHGHILSTNIEPMDVSSLKFYSGDSNDKLTKLSVSKQSKQATQLTNTISECPQIEPVTEEVIPQCVGIQCISLPPHIDIKDNFKISHLMPSEDGQYLLVTISVEHEETQQCDPNLIEIDSKSNFLPEKNTLGGYFLVYSIASDSMYVIEEAPLCSKELTVGKLPRDLCMLPPQVNISQSFATVCNDGSIRTYSLPDLNETSYLKNPNGNFVSLTYCISVERLTACTDTGFLYFFSVGETNSYQTQEKDEEEIGKGQTASKIVDPVESSCLLTNKTDLNSADLKSLMSLTGLFGKNISIPYSAVVPSFWCELSPAQRPRSDNQNHRTWRLQTNVSTWDEHLLELTLPYNASLAHIQFSFTLHQPCVTLPIIQVTLLKQILHGFGCKKNYPMKIQEDSPIQFRFVESGSKQSADNPVNTKEYLRAHNAEILAGPVLLSQGLDLGRQAGSLFLTSPQLYRSKGRTFLIHIKTLFDPAKDMGKITKPTESSGKKAEFIGCDWLHHISITVRGIQRSNIPEYRLLRISMIESNDFLNNLFQIACKSDDTDENRMLALDIILWIISVRLQRFRPAKPDKRDLLDQDGNPIKSNVTLSSNELQQIECIKVIEKNIHELIISCILNAKRSSCKKVMMIILVTSEGMKNLSKPWECSFDKIILNSVISCIPFLAACPSPGSMHWLIKLAIQVSLMDSEGVLNDKCIEVIVDAATVMEKRMNPYYCLLRSRFGLYGLPLDQEIFQQEPPILDKSQPPIVPYGASAMANEPSNFDNPNAPRVQHDLRDLYYLSTDQDARKSKSWWEEWDSVPVDDSLPLNVICHSSSDGTKLESAFQASQQEHPTQLWVKVKECKINPVKPSGETDSQKSWDAHEELPMECEEEEAGTKSGGQPNPLQDPLLKMDNARWSLSWGWLLSGSGSHTLLVERMHSGARRFAVLQLPREVYLTDVIIPACTELVSLSVDVWLTDEEKDCTKLIHHTSIATAPLLLTNIQPPPLCRYIKITTIGRYGMPAMKCRIPLGHFYGEVADLPDEESAVDSLISLREDVICRLRLASNKLRQYLDPHLENFDGNVGHIKTYLNSLGQVEPKVLNAYEEATNLQQQLSRIENVLSKIRKDKRPSQCVPSKDLNHRDILEKISTDKLRVLIDNLLHILLYLNFEAEDKTWTGRMSEEQCACLMSLVVLSETKTAAAVSALLSRLCGNAPWWPRLLPTALISAALKPTPLPLDRFLILVIVMARRSLLASPSVETGVVEAIASSVLETTGPARVLTLTLLAACMDAVPQSRSSWKRWDFVSSGRAAVQSKEDASSNNVHRGGAIDNRLHRRKLHKKLVHNKHIMPQEFDTARRAVLLSQHVQRLSSMSKQRSLSENPVESAPQLMTSKTAAALVRNLLNLLNEADNDLLILVAKVVGRVIASRGGGALAVDSLKLLCRRAVSAPAWPAHALTALLQDFVEYEYLAPGDQEISEFSRVSQEDDPSLLRPRSLKVLASTRSPANLIAPANVEVPTFIESEDSDGDLNFEERLAIQQYCENTGRDVPKFSKRPVNTMPHCGCISSMWCSGIEWRAGVAAECAGAMGAGALKAAISTPLMCGRVPSPPRARRQRHLDVHKQLHEAFTELCADMSLQHDSSYMENVLSLWMTLNATAKPETPIQWVPVTENMESPRIKLSVNSIQHLLQSLVQQENVSLRCWVMALHTLAWVCQSSSQPLPNGNNSSNRAEDSVAASTLRSPNFVPALVKFLTSQFTNDGVCQVAHLTAEWSAILGPTACAALSYLLRRTCGSQTYGAAVVARIVSASLRSRSAIDVRVAAARHLLYAAKNLTSQHREDAFALIDVTALALAEWMCSKEASRIDTSTLTATENPFSEPTLDGLVGIDRITRKAVDRKQLLATVLHCCRLFLSLPLDVDVMPFEQNSQTDESKVSQQMLSDTDDDKRTKQPKLADLVLQSRSTIFRLLKALTYCNATNSALSKKSDRESQQISETLPLADELYLFMITLADLATKPELIITPILQFLRDYRVSRAREETFSDAFNRLVERVITECGGKTPWCSQGGMGVAITQVKSSTISQSTFAASLLDHLKLPPKLLPLPPKRTPPTQSDLLHQGLINYGPLCTVTCSNPTAQAADVLLGGGPSATATARRVRAAAWAYHFYGGDEPALTLALTPPHAFRLHELHLQPHLTGLATCPSAVGVEVSCGCNNVPLGAPQPTAGLTFIRLALSVPTVVTAIQIKLYKPRDSSNMGLLNLRILGAPTFYNSNSIERPLCSEGWLRIISECVDGPVSNEELWSAAEACAALAGCSQAARDALRSLVVKRSELARYILRLLLAPSPIAASTNSVEECCSLVHWICTNGSDAVSCLSILLSFCLTSEAITPPQLQCLAATLWWYCEHCSTASLLLSHEDCLTMWTRILDVPLEDKILKSSLDTVLCSMCYLRPEFYKYILQQIEAAIMGPPQEKECETDEKQEHTIEAVYKWSAVPLSHLTTVAVAAQSPLTSPLLLASRVPFAVIHTLTKFGQQRIVDVDIRKLPEPVPTCETNSQGERVSVEIARQLIGWLVLWCESRAACDWLGTCGSSFWKPLLLALCIAPIQNQNWDDFEVYRDLEEQTIKLFNLVTTMNPITQKIFASTMREVLKAYSEFNSGATGGLCGFTRNLVVRVLLTSERANVGVNGAERPARHPRLYPRGSLNVQARLTLSDLLQLRNATKGTMSSSRVRTSSAVEPTPGSDWDLSVAAASCAKDKRAKEASNSRAGRRRRSTQPNSQREVSEGAQTTVACVDGIQGHVPLNLTISDVCAALPLQYGAHLIVDFIDKDSNESTSTLTNIPSTLNSETPSLLSALGSDLALLPTARAPPQAAPTPPYRPSDPYSDWIPLDELFEQETTTATQTSTEETCIPDHSLFALGLLLKLPGYADAFLKEGTKAVNLLRLLLAVTDDEDGRSIARYSAAGLGTLPFCILAQLLEEPPPHVDSEHNIRRALLKGPLVPLLFTCLAVFTHHADDCSPNEQSHASNSSTHSKSDDKKQLYWAKGTGFGTGSTQQSWNVEQALLRQKTEEEHVTVLLQVISAYIHPNEEWNPENPTQPSVKIEPPNEFINMLCSSALVPAICSYLRNDSVLDMSRHIELYVVVIKTTRALWAIRNIPRVARALRPLPALVAQMARTTAAYAATLRANKKVTEVEKKCASVQQIKKTTPNTNSSSTIVETVEEDEGLAALILDIKSTATIMQADEESGEWTVYRPAAGASREARYIEVMRTLQFDSFEMMEENPDGSGCRFAVSYAFEAAARTAGSRAAPQRMKRLAQEAATLASSLPLSYSSSVFVRTDTARLDIMKVLITGPSDTPYANGCFILDVYFPPEYPSVPMIVNLETTGRHTVRFNPNLYNDGKVCLSVLNTWHGRPEEKWNAHTSSFLQVLVSIQSLILVPEPYFNEPGYERSRGTHIGSQASMEYNSNIYQACVRWAMLDHLRTPPPCFQDVIQTHFWIKRNEICRTVAGWINELENHVTDKRTQRSIAVNLTHLKRHYTKLCEELSRLTAPSGLEDLNEEFTPPPSSIATSASAATTTPAPPSDTEMEKIVSQVID